jgi:pantothenate kinase type III
MSTVIKTAGVSNTQCKKFTDFKDSFPDEYEQLIKSMLEDTENSVFIVATSVRPPSNVRKYYVIKRSFEIAIDSMTSEANKELLKQMYNKCNNQQRCVIFISWDYTNTSVFRLAVVPKSQIL